MFEHEPQSGFFKVRRWRRVAFAPALVRWDPPQIEAATGELLADEACRAVIDGFAVDPWEAWTWIAKHPINLEEWRWLAALAPLVRARTPRGQRPWWERGSRPPL